MAREVCEVEREGVDRQVGHGRVDSVSEAVAGPQDGVDPGLLERE